MTAAAAAAAEGGGAGGEREEAALWRLGLQRGQLELGIEAKVLGGQGGAGPETVDVALEGDLKILFALCESKRRLALAH